MKTFEYRGYIIEINPYTQLYHGTTNLNKESVRQHGLDPNYSEWEHKHIWLDVDYSSAYNWGNQWDGEPIVYMVYAKDLNLDKLHIDYNNTEYFDEIIDYTGELGLHDMTFVYEDVIPPHKLYVVE